MESCKKCRVVEVCEKCTRDGKHKIEGKTGWLCTFHFNRYIKEERINRRKNKSFKDISKRVNKLQKRAVRENKIITVSCQTTKQCPYYKMLTLCVWRADIKCNATACTFMNQEQLVNR